MYIPSYDFGIFDIDAFSELQANEYGAMTRFSGNTPVSYVDFSLNQLYGLLNPSNPYPYISRQPTQTIIPRELQDFFAQKDKVIVYPSGTVPPELQRQGPPVAQGNKVMCDPNDTSWSGYTKRLLGICCTQGISPDGKSCTLHSDDSSVGTTTPSGERIGDVTAAWFGSLPQGAGVFLIGIAVVILLILFVRK
jgi:hypothetical protein